MKKALKAPLLLHNLNGFGQYGWGDMIIKHTPPWESATAHVMREVLKPNIGDPTFCISTNCYYLKEVHSYYEWMKSSLQKAILSK